MMKDRLSICIIEDNPGDLLLLQQLLVIGSIPSSNIIVAGQLSEALTILQEEKKPDLIFLDLFLPDSDGLDTFHVLSNSAASIPIIILSGLSDAEIAVKAIQAGAQDYLIKGEFDEKILEKTIVYSIERKKISERLNASLEIHELVGAATNDIIWDWNLSNKTIVPLSKAVHTDYGYSPATMQNTVDWWYDKIHPDDIKDLVCKISEAIISRTSKGAHEFRFQRANGEYRDVYGRANILYKQTNEGLRAYRLIGIMQDITDLKKTQDRLQWVNERYETISHVTSDVVYDWNLRTGKVSYGKGDMQKVFGYKGVEEVNESWWFEHLHPDDRGKTALNITKAIQSRLPVLQNEFRFLCADGGYKHIFGKGHFFYTDEGEVYRMVGAMQDVTQIRTMQKRMQKQKVINQQKITEVTILSQEEERQMLGRELHDNINQILATCKMFIDISIKRPSEREELLPKSFTYMEMAIEELRKLSKSLVPPSLGDIGLPEALKELLANAAVGKETKYTFAGEDFSGLDIPDTLQLMIYRIAQEQLNNISKYAKARHVTVCLKADNTHVHIQIVDDGVGFDTSKVVAGIGLRNIKSRTSLYGGKMTIVSEPGKGCALSVTVPVKKMTETSKKKHG